MIFLSFTETAGPWLCAPPPVRLLHCSSFPFSFNALGTTCSPSFPPFIPVLVLFPRSRETQAPYTPPTSPPSSLPTKGPSHQETLKLNNCEVSKTGRLKGREDGGAAIPELPHLSKSWLSQCLATKAKAPRSPYPTPVVSPQRTERSDLYRGSPLRTAIHQSAFPVAT